MCKSKVAVIFALIVAMIILVVGIAPTSSGAASHREAPAIALDPGADITDVFFFRSYEGAHGDRIVLIMDVIPGQDPSSGPNYWNFDDNVLYAFNIDNNMDGLAEDIVFQFKFQTEIRGAVAALGLPLSYLGDVRPGVGDVVPPITMLDGAGSEGLGLRQKYSVKMIRDDDDDDDETLGKDLIAVPSNVGPRTMPSYEALAAQGIYDLGNGIRVFAGQRDDPFYIDLGAVFDTLNLRSPAIDTLQGFNVSTIALEVPASLLTKDGQGPEDTAFPVLGLYASTSRRAKTVLRTPRLRFGDDNNDREELIRTSGRFMQVQRLANPLVNELVIGTPVKDLWNRLDPSQEAFFEDFYLNPRLALALELIIGVDAETANRTDLRDLLLKYAQGPSDQQLSELLRLNVSVDPVPLGSQNRLGGLGGDAAGYPNGRRPGDDTVDISLQVVGGPNYIAIGAGDNVNGNDFPLPEAFPFLATPSNGVERVFANP